MLKRAALLGLLVALCGSGDGLAQGRAEGSYPAILTCDKLPFTAGTLRDQFTLEIGGGKASYARKLTWADAPEVAGSMETGSGTLAAGRLTLTGRAKGKAASFEASYAGDVSGTGGLLIGRQRWTYKGKSYDRLCQLSIGNGRG